MSGDGRDRGTLDGVTGNVGAPSLEEQINAVGFGRFQWTLLLIFGLLVIADGMEMVVISVLYLPLKNEWGLSEAEEGYLAAMVFVGILGGNLVGGYMGDSLGRRTTVLFSGIFFIVAAIGSAFSPDVITLAICRMFVGFAVGCKLPVAMSLAVELCPTEHRGKLGMVLVGIAFALGEIFVCVVGMIILQYDASANWWRWLLMGCAFPDIFGVPLAWIFMPESPHWLLSRGKHEELSEQILAMAKMNGTEDKMLQDGRVRQLVEEPDVDKWSWSTIFSPQLRGTTIYCSVIWCVCAICYHGHIFVYPLVLEHRYHMLVGDALWAIALAGAAEIPGVLIGMWLIDVDGIGRRTAMLAFFGVGAITALCVPLFDSSTSFLAANMVLKPLINTPFCIIYIVASELYPTTHRSSGIAFCSSTSRLAGVATPIILAWCLAQSVTLTYQVFAFFLCLGAVATLLYGQETLNTDLKTFVFETVGPEDEERTPLKASVLHP